MGILLRRHCIVHTSGECRLVPDLSDAVLNLSRCWFCKLFHRYSGHFRSRNGASATAPSIRGLATQTLSQSLTISLTFSSASNLILNPSVFRRGNTHFEFRTIPMRGFYPLTRTGRTWECNSHCICRCTSYHQCLFCICTIQGTVKDFKATPASPAFGPVSVRLYFETRNIPINLKHRRMPTQTLDNTTTIGDLVTSFSCICQSRI